VFRTGQRYDVLIENAQGREVWRWSDGRMFTQVMGEETLAPAKRIRYRVSLQTKLSPGRYKIRGVVPAEGQPLSAATTIKVE
jgi:hypothetical protein